MIKCTNCGKQINETTDLSIELRKPCPNCGFLGRSVDFTFNETIGLYDYFLKRFKQIDPSLSGKDKVRLDEINGVQLNKGSGKLVNKEWRINRNHNPPWYYEEITDINTGEVLHLCSEPLSEHIARGSAKKEIT